MELLINRICISDDVNARAGALACAKQAHRKSAKSDNKVLLHHFKSRLLGLFTHLNSEFI